MGRRLLRIALPRTNFGVRNQGPPPPNSPLKVPAAQVSTVDPEYQTLMMPCTASGQYFFRTKQAIIGSQKLEQTQA